MYQPVHEKDKFCNFDPITAALASIGIGGAAAAGETAAGLTAATGIAGAAGTAATVGETAAGLTAATGVAGAAAPAAAAAGGLFGTGISGTTALSAASLAGTVGSTLIGMQGQRQTAAAQAAAANYQAQVAANNQIIAQQNARYATAAGAANAQAQDLQTRRLLGEEVAAQGASGIDITTGSPFDVTQSTRQIGRLQTADVVQQANLQAYGYGTQAMSFGAQSALERQQAGYAQQAGAIGAAGTLLGGASSFANKWLQYQQQGVPGFGGGTAPGAGGI